jgi:hypothetical protein
MNSWHVACNVVIITKMNILRMKNRTETNIQGQTESTTFEQVREFVTGLLQQGNSPQEVAQSLTYTAVEMSLQLAENKLSVLPILMDSMARAAHAYEASNEQQIDHEVMFESCDLQNATIH